MTSIYYKWIAWHLKYRTDIYIKLIIEEIKKEAQNVNSLVFNKDDEYIFGEELDGMVKSMKSFTIQKYHGRRITKDTLEELLKHYDNPVFNISGTVKFTEQMKDILLNQLHVVNENVRVSSFGKGYDN